MPPPHRTSGRAAERRRVRRQRRAEDGTLPRPASREQQMAPLSLDPKRRAAMPTMQAVQRLDPETEYRLVRRDLWRLAIYSAICFVVMIAVLLLVGC